MLFFQKHGEVRSNNSRTVDNTLHNAGLSFLLSEVSLYEARLGSNERCEKIKHDSSFELPVWISSNVIKTPIRLSTAERLTLVVEGNNLQAVLRTAGAGTQN